MTKHTVRYEDLYKVLPDVKPGDEIDLIIDHFPIDLSNVRHEGKEPITIRLVPAFAHQTRFECTGVQRFPPKNDPVLTKKRLLRKEYPVHVANIASAGYVPAVNFQDTTMELVNVMAPDRVLELRTIRMSSDLTNEEVIDWNSLTREELIESCEFLADEVHRLRKALKIIADGTICPELFPEETNEDVLQCKTAMVSAIAALEPRA
jgi:hypothetical protein